MWNAKIKRNAQIHMSSHMEDGKWGTPEHAFGSSVHIAALSSFHSTAQERQILRLTPEPWLFLPLIVRLDPGYRNGKRSTNIKLALNSNEFFFLSLSLKGEKKTKASHGFLFLTYNKFH